MLRRFLEGIFSSAGTISKHWNLLPPGTREPLSRGLCDKGGPGGGAKRVALVVVELGCTVGKVPMKKKKQTTKTKTPKARKFENIRTDLADRVSAFANA